MKRIIDTGLQLGTADVVRHAYRWGCDWPTETAEYSNIDSRVIRDGDLLRTSNENGTPVLYHRASSAKGSILGAYVVAICRQIGASVYMLIATDTLDDAADKYIYRIGITREEVLEETAVRIFLAAPCCLAFAWQSA